jgi:hypothetical protein
MSEESLATQNRLGQIYKIQRELVYRLVRKYKLEPQGIDTKGYKLFSVAEFDVAWNQYQQSIAKPAVPSMTVPEYRAATGAKYSVVTHLIKTHKIKPTGRGGRNNSALLYPVAELDAACAEYQRRQDLAASLMDVRQAAEYTGYSRAYLVSSFKAALVIGKAHYFSQADLDAGLRRNGHTPKTNRTASYCAHCGVDLSQAKQGAGDFCGDCIRDLLRGQKLQLATARV